MANLEGYEAILAESERVGWPESYIKDLYVVDFEKLMKDDAPVNFGWCLRECGTFLFLERNDDQLDGIQACKKEYPFPDGRYYFFDGRTLHEVVPDQLIVWQEDGVIALPAGTLEVTSLECIELSQKCRALQREMVQLIEQTTIKSEEDYLDGRRVAYGACAVKISGYESSYISNVERATRIKKERLNILLSASKSHNVAIRSRDAEEQKYSRGKEHGYLDAVWHFSDLLGMPKPAIYKGDEQSRTSHPGAAR